MISNILMGRLFCVLLAVGAMPRTSAQSVPPTVDPAPASFRHDDGHLGGKLLLALGFLSFVAAGAVVLVRLKQDGKLSLLPGALAKHEGCLVLETKRVGAKLMIVTLKVPGGAIVTIAENGHSICLLNRREAGALSVHVSTEEMVDAP